MCFIVLLQSSGSKITIRIHNTDRPSLPFSPLLTANTTTELRFAPILQGTDLRTLDTVQSAVKNVEVDEQTLA